MCSRSTDDVPVEGLHTMRTRVALTILVSGLAAWASGASAGFQALPKTIPALESSIPIIGKMSASEPDGFTALCRRLPDRCRPVPARADVEVTPSGAVRLTPALTRMVVEVNRLTNLSIRPQAELRGAPDNWKIGGLSGDCEDYALAKRERLIRAGFPTSALPIATAHLPNGEYHAVLVVRTDRGDYVLDNLSRAVTPVAKSRLRFQILQSPVDPRSWLAL